MEEDDEFDNVDLDNDEEEEEEDEDFYDEQEDQDEFSHLSDEELALVENFILVSAKTRFNYAELLEDFVGAEGAFVDVEFLLPLIAGKAFGEPDSFIAEKMLASFILCGYQIEMDELMKIIEQKGKELGPEILAFKIAADSLQQGAHPREIVTQLSQLLKA